MAPVTDWHRNQLLASVQRAVVATRAEAHISVCARSHTAGMELTMMASTF